MLIELGRFVTPEAVVDLTTTGLVVTLANGEDTEAVLKPLRYTKLETPAKVAVDYRTYALSPSGRPTVEDSVAVWAWVANYYWQPPKKPVTLRKAAITLARVSKAEYRVELEVAEVATQYILDRPTVRVLEEAYRLTRQTM